MNIKPFLEMERAFINVNYYTYVEESKKTTNRRNRFRRKDDYENNGAASEKMTMAAEEIGKLLAEANSVVVTGGKDGIMEAAAKGAKLAAG